jgi:hypothetical protein
MPAELPTEQQLLLYSLEHIKATLALTIEPGAVTELRILEAYEEGRYCKTVSGYFDYDHLDQMAELAAYWSGKAKGVYWIPNPINPRCAFRAYNRVQKWAKTTTEDEEVLGWRWLLIDCDVVRPKDVSSTDEEVALAIERARIVRAHLWETGVCRTNDTILAMSGNGAHVLMRVDFSNEKDAAPESAAALSAFLKGLSQQFSDDRVFVDPSTFNAPRLFKLYGTMARKGDLHAQNPHRVSHLVEVPNAG